MTLKEFSDLFSHITKRSSDKLMQKRNEYATPEDVLHNFKAAGAAQSIPPSQALVGMATKQFISIADMSKCPTMYNLDLWREKIGDLLNYCILLEATVIDAGVQSATVASVKKGSTSHS